MKYYNSCYQFLGRWIEGKEKKMELGMGVELGLS